MKWVRIDHGVPGIELPGGLRAFPDDRHPQRYIRAEATPRGTYALYRRAYWWHRMAARRRAAREQSAI